MYTGFTPNLDFSTLLREEAAFLRDFLPAENFSHNGLEVSVIMYLCNRDVERIKTVAVPVVVL